jgi:hypothetical protein
VGLAVRRKQPVDGCLPSIVASRDTYAHRIGQPFGHEETVIDLAVNGPLFDLMQSFS